MTVRNLATNACRVSAREAAVQDDLEEVREVVLRGLGPVRAKVFLFGSRASGKATGISDIDVAVLPLETLPDGMLSRIREALEESTIPYHVDVVDLSTVDEGFREQVLAEGVPWNA